jgi:alginate O-acetyltransferase complex protein AlgJ
MKTHNPEVVIGEDGWLYLGTGSNDFMSYIQGKATLPPQTVDYWQAVLSNRQRWFRKAGIKYMHVFAPEKVTVYPEYYGEPVDTSLGHIAVLSRHCPELFLNVISYFNAIKDKYRLYDKTDTHWNRTGAFACYQLVCSSFGYKAVSDLTVGPKTRVNALFDLGAKLSPPLREQVEAVQRQGNARRAFANLLIRFKEMNQVENEVGLHVGSRAIFRNDKSLYKEKVIIFGDSFSEYRLGRLTEMFSETFSEVHFCWSSNVDFNYVRSVKPGLVITELCERFAVAVPNDHFLVDKFARGRLYDYLRGRQSIASHSDKHSTLDTVTPTPKALQRLSRLPATGARGPDYLIVGGMKCGTTILNDFISGHPNVCAAKEKEIHYFSLHYDKGEAWYADFFSAVPDDKVTGEASPTYLDMTNGATMPKLIGTTLPGVRIIAIVKDPVDRAISHFFHLKNINKLPAFQCLDPNEVFSGDLYHKYNEDFLRDPALWPLRYVLDFGNYFQRLFFFRQVFEDRLLVLTNRELWANGQVTMNRVFGHLHLPSYESTMFERKNYVTPAAQKKLSCEAIESLGNYYRTDVEMVRERLGIVLR